MLGIDGGGPTTDITMTCSPVTGSVIAIGTIMPSAPPIDTYDAESGGGTYGYASVACGICPATDIAAS